MKVSNRIVIISIAIVLLGNFQPISAIDDQRFIDDLEEVSKKHGYSPTIKKQGNDQYTIEFTFNRINSPNVDRIRKGNDRSGTIFYGRDRITGPTGGSQPIKFYRSGSVATPKLFRYRLTKEDVSSPSIANLQGYQIPSNDQNLSKGYRKLQAPPNELRKCYEEARNGGLYVGGLFAGDFLHKCLEENENKINEALQFLINSNSN